MAKGTLAAGFRPVKRYLYVDDFICRKAERVVNVQETLNPLPSAVYDLKADRVVVWFDFIQPEHWTLDNEVDRGRAEAVANDLFGSHSDAHRHPDFFRPAARSEYGRRPGSIC